MRCADEPPTLGGHRSTFTDDSSALSCTLKLLSDPPPDCHSSRVHRQLRLCTQQLCGDSVRQRPVPLVLGFLRRLNHHPGREPCREMHFCFLLHLCYVLRLLGEPLMCDVIPFLLWPFIGKHVCTNNSGRCLRPCMNCRANFPHLSPSPHAVPRKFTPPPPFSPCRAVQVYPSPSTLPS